MFYGEGKPKIVKFKDHKNLDNVKFYGGPLEKIIFRKASNRQNFVLNLTSVKKIT